MSSQARLEMLRSNVSDAIGKQQVTSIGRGTSTKSSVHYRYFKNDENGTNGESSTAKTETPLNTQLQTAPETESTDEAEVKGISSLASTKSVENEEDVDFESGLSKDLITEWQAGWNVTNAIQGMFIVSFPYTVLQGGYWALVAMVLVAYICYHTGNILVSCLYEVDECGQAVRVRESYADIAEVVFGKRFGRSIVNTAQLIELLMTCILYVLLCGDLLQGSFAIGSLPLSAWISLSAIPLLMCAFLKTLRRVSWLSLWCSVAHMLINLIIIIYCLTLVKQWQPLAVKIKPDIWTVPISLGIIVFSYTSQIFLPTLEGKMVDKSRFSCMMSWTHIAAAFFKAVFSYIGFVTWGDSTEEVITNNLPHVLKIIVNVILVIKALLSYPLPYFAAVDIIEKAFFQGRPKTYYPGCYNADKSISWWAIGLRLLLVICTMLMAIFIPHFALLMGLIGSFTGTMLSFVWPCIFHLLLKKDSLRWWQKVGDIIIILLGILCGTMGIYYSSRALVIAFQAGDSSPLKNNANETLSAVYKGVNETLKSHLMG